MTQAEVEAELGNLRVRLLQFEQAQESRKKAWRGLGFASFIIVLLYAVAGLASIAVEVWFHISGIPPMYVSYSHLFLVVLIPGAMLARALLAGQTPLWPRRQAGLEEPEGNKE